MPLTLAEYADRLDNRDGLRPEVPPAIKPKATPFTRPLPGIQAVTFDVYGTLLRITGGRLALDGPDRLSVQIAFEKTVEEFNIWNFLFRKPGPPWQQVYEQYKKLLDDARMTKAVRKGEFPEIDTASEVWRKLIAQWDRKEFSYDASTLGDRDALAEKIAYFFHARLQAVEAAPHAATTMMALANNGKRIALLSDSQCFTPLQLQRALDAQHAGASDAIDPAMSVLSFSEGVCKPSPSLYEAGLARLQEQGIDPSGVLHVGSRLKADLGVAKQLGMRTALYAGDTASLEASKEEIRDPRLVPDRLVTDLAQLGEVVGIG